MLRYIAKRLAYALPTLWVVTVLAFLLSRAMPGDPAAKFCIQSDEELSSLIDYKRSQKQYEECVKQLTFDRPLFYFSVLPAAYPDTFYQLIGYQKRQWAKQLLHAYPDWPAVQAYCQSISTVYNTGLKMQASQPAWKDSITQLRYYTQQLLHTTQPAEIDALLSASDKLYKNIHIQADSVVRTESMVVQLSKAKDAWQALQQESSRASLFWPTPRWHGTNCQYHIWISGILRADWGLSSIDRKPVFKKIGQSIRWTLLLSLSALLLAFGIAIPVGAWAGYRANGSFDKWSNRILMALFSLPAFWIATLLLIFFSTPEYGMDWFPSSGIGNTPPDAPWWEVLRVRIAHFFLPVLCLSYGAMAYIARQMRGGVADVMQQLFVTAAKAKGVKDRKLLWRHAVPNALFPIITLMGNVLPALIAGSIVIEVIFSIPGMGLTTFQSIMQEDWNVVFGILLLSAVLTILGILIADIMYARIDPRVKLK